MHATDYSDEIAQTSICFPFLKSIALDTGRLYSLYDNAEMAFFQAVIAYLRVTFKLNSLKKPHFCYVQI